MLKKIYLELMKCQGESMNAYYLLTPSSTSNNDSFFFFQCDSLRPHLSCLTGATPVKPVSVPMRPAQHFVRPYPCSIRIFSLLAWCKRGRSAYFSTGQPLKLRVMPVSIVITVQDLRELWRCPEGLSREPFDKRAPAGLTAFPVGWNWRR